MKKLFLIFFLITNLNLFSQKEILVYFSSNKSYMLDSSRQKLKKLIDLKQIKSINAIFGYTDSIASNNYNIRLAERRILDVQYYLKSNGVKLSPNYTSHAVGENFKNHGTLAKNRKVVIQYNNIEDEDEDENEDTDRNSIQKLTTLKKGELVTLRHLNFQPGLAVFRDIAYPVLADLVKLLKKRKDIKITIHGHICCTLVDDTNLSTLRALKVKNHLIYNGIDEKRLKHEGHGSSTPIYALPEKNEQQREANRRVEIEINSIGE